MRQILVYLRVLIVMRCIMAAIIDGKEKDEMLTSFATINILFGTIYARHEKI